jgi:hypothetical protein
VTQDEVDLGKPHPRFIIDDFDRLIFPGVDPTAICLPTLTDASVPSVGAAFKAT